MGGVGGLGRRQWRWREIDEIKAILWCVLTFRTVMYYRIGLRLGGASGRGGPLKFCRPNIGNIGSSFLKLAMIRFNCWKKNAWLVFGLVW